MHTITSVLLATICAASGLHAQDTVLRPTIRSITRLQNLDIPLEGHGLVTGLNATGSSGRINRVGIANFLRRWDLDAVPADLSNGAVAVVRVHATLRPFAKMGQRIDIYVSNIGDSTSLRGGDLILTDLTEVGENSRPGQVWVAAVGPITVSGISAGGRTARVTVNHPTTGVISRGGQVLYNRDSSFFSENGDLELLLLNPSVGTATSIASGIRRVLDGTGFQVKAVDESMVRIMFPEEQQTDETAMRIIDLIANVRVAVENPSKVIADETTGMVIAGGGVMISPCVVALSDLTISVISEEEVVQPFPGFNRGTTEIVDRTHIELQTQNTNPVAVDLTPLDGATVTDLLANLQALKLTPQQLITVFQALSNGGFLHAELETR